MSTSNVKSPEGTYYERADREAHLLNRFIYRDYKKRLVPFMARSTKGFRYEPPTYSMSSRTDDWGNLYYIRDDTPKLISPVLLPSEPKQDHGMQVVNGWQVDVDAPPTWMSRFFIGPNALGRLSLKSVVQVTRPDETEPTVTAIPGLTYPLKWAELNLNQVMPEDPNDELYALHFETLREIRAEFGDSSSPQ